MKIKATIERIPGGMMLIPLLLGAVLNTLAPDTGAYFGSFTKGMISGTVPILAVWFLYRRIYRFASNRYGITQVRYAGNNQNSRGVGSGNDCCFIYS